MPPPPPCSGQRRASISSRLRRRCSQKFFFFFALLGSGQMPIFFLWPAPCAGRARTRKIAHDSSSASDIAASVTPLPPFFTFPTAFNHRPSLQCRQLPAQFYPSSRSVPQSAALLFHATSSSRRRARRRRRVTSWWWVLGPVPPAAGRPAEFSCGNPFVFISSIPVRPIRFRDVALLMVSAAETAHGI